MNFLTCLEWFLQTCIWNPLHVKRKVVHKCLFFKKTQLQDQSDLKFGVNTAFISDCLYSVLPDVALKMHNYLQTSFIRSSLPFLIKQKKVGLLRTDFHVCLKLSSLSVSKNTFCHLTVPLLPTTVYYTGKLSFVSFTRNVLPSLGKIPTW